MSKSAELRTLPHTPEIPFDPRVSTYTLFGGLFDGKFEPYEYAGWVDECMSWKRTCYIGDWSPLSNKFLVKGRDALKFFSNIVVNSLAKFEIGQAKHMIMCNRSGKIVCEGISMRLAEDEIIFTSGPVFWPGFMFAKGGYDATATQLGEVQFIKQVQGPNALYVLEKATGESLRDIGFMRFRKTQIGNRPFYILRQGMSGELGYELHGSSEHAVAIHQAILDAGEEFGISRLGGRTKMINHVEACFPTPTVDFVPAIYEEKEYLDWKRSVSPHFTGRTPPGSGSFVASDVSAYFRSPVELGWSKNIKFDHDFVGREALAAEVANPKRTMVTLVWNSEDVIDVYASLFREGDPYEVMELPRNGLGRIWADKVMSDGTLVGVTTSRCYSYFSRKMISLCTIDVAQSKPGNEVTVIWGRPGGTQKHVRATVAPAPYKRDNRRIDVSALPSLDQARSSRG